MQVHTKDLDVKHVVRNCQYRQSVFGCEATGAFCNVSTGGWQMAVTPHHCEEWHSRVRVVAEAALC